MQRLLNHAVWDHQQAMGVVRGFVAEHLADPGAVVVIDESGQEKAGAATVGVKRQYVGCAGKITNAVNVVYATWASCRGHAPVAARLYLPAEWAADPERRASAGVPEHVDTDSVRRRAAASRLGERVEGAATWTASPATRR